MPGNIKTMLAAGGEANSRRRIAVNDLKLRIRTSHVSPYDLGEDLIGHKPHPQSPGRTRRDRPRHRRCGAKSVNFADL